MKKLEQKMVNATVEVMYDRMYEEIKTGNYHRLGRLRTCQAWVIETENYYVLQSYNTLVALIPIGTAVCYDFLRMVYGFTSTSAQHISKFKQDYGTGNWGCDTTLVYRSI